MIPITRASQCLQELKCPGRRGFFFQKVALFCVFFILVILKRAGECSTLLCSLWCNLLLPGLASGIKSEVSGLVGWVLFGQNQPRLEKTKLKAKFSEYINIFLLLKKKIFFSHNIMYELWKSKLLEQGVATPCCFIS